MRIVDRVNKIPGGMMIIPLFLGSIVGTFFPGFLNIGSFTTALFKNGALPLIALLILATGAQITFAQTKGVLTRTGVLLLMKTIIPGLLIVGYGFLFGKSGLWGFSLLAVLTAFINSNGGLWLALASLYGDKEDVGAYIASGLNDGPFFTLLFLGLSGLGKIPWLYIVAAIVPFVVGLILGNLDRKFGEMMKPTASITIPFFAFALGAGINLKSLVIGGLRGIVLGVLVSIITGSLGYLGYRYLLGKKREDGAIGFGIGSTAGNSVATPPIVAQGDPSFKPYVDGAVSQVSTSVLVTALLTPIITAYLYRKLQKANKQANDSKQ
jgi:2-keto-3-deoxygluconate permease